ncbi:monovalent cation/H+ antiporter subunit D family protein [Actinophytocola gossypii]|uniref:Monovalent cation/H+ antiporter subunit D family protein n=1 Tax=Actinophytocola gossypii TaxID=2812003 RepID=A0ABT2JAD4_9PSEU|nr:monovalent cation/H+ antiporter subunit D family protein [Actinophytocola gossypii]MCT2584425.1 monovalent cation/H+ antiporter subunit D family protein [Actinophytocola gossypii]
MTAHLPALQVLVPLGCAPLCLLLRRFRTVTWLVFLLAALSSLACAVLLATRVDDGPLHYEMGGWPAPYGIEFVVAGFNTPVLLVVSVVAVVAAVYARRSVGDEVDDRRAPLVYTCLCLTLTGLLGLTVTGDVFNAFVFLEISSLSTYALIAMGRRRRALLASFRYLVIGTVGATFVLIGIGFAYAVTGTLNMADLADRLTDLDGNRALYAAVVFVFVGLAVKMAVFPLHAWLPAAYGEAPSAVSTFLAAASTKVAIYVFCRFAFTVFGAGLVFTTMPVGEVGLLLAALAMLVGSAAACFQRDLKYLLAWSSVAQIGYIVAGISLATAAGVSAGYLHVINHAVIKGALFGAAGLLVLRLGSARLDDLAGLGRRMPWTFAAIVVTGLGLVGVPPTAGFASKWALVSALLDAGAWPVLVAVLASSLLALVYVGRIVEAAWFRDPPADLPADQPRAPVSMVAAVWALVLLSVYFGIDASLPGGLADAAAAALLGTGGA